MTKQRVDTPIGLSGAFQQSDIIKPWGRKLIKMEYQFNINLNDPFMPPFIVYADTEQEAIDKFKEAMKKHLAPMPESKVAWLSYGEFLPKRITLE